MKYSNYPNITEYECGNGCKVFIRTNIPFLEVTLKFYAERFFSVAHSVLYIIDATLFSSTSELLSHLRRVSAVKPDAYVLIIHDNIPALSTEKKSCPWIISTKNSIHYLASSLKKLKKLKTADNNLAEIVSYFENIRSMGNVNAKQAQMLELICMGNSIDHIAASMNLSPKSVYSNLRKISSYLGMKNLPQLITFMLRERYLPFEMFNS